jgi:hypothetical protein
MKKLFLFLMVLFLYELSYAQECVAGPTVLDNPEADFVYDMVDWGTSASGGYNGDYRWHEAGTGLSTATWTPDIDSAGTYNVYGWWKASSNRATDAPYTIYYDGGSETVDVNQQLNDSQWNLLGTYSFAAGQSGYVVLSDDANSGSNRIRALSPIWL